MSRTVIESEERLSRSRLWRMQRAFFEESGPDAWREAIVPHYVTSNPYIAAAYAELVLGYWRDAWPTLTRSQPLYVVELGAGPGRFAFHFLRAMTALVARSPLAADVRFVYVLTDVVERNLEFVASHPALAPFIDAGQLDFARFDATCDDEIRLQRSGVTLGAGAAANPLVAIANYVFDGVPQDMFWVERGRLHESLVTLGCEEAPADPDDPALIGKVALGWTRRAAAGAYYGEERRDAILEAYRARLSDGAFSFPSVAIRAVDALAAIAGGQLLLVSADKGQSHEATLARRAEPALTVHGSFSLPVNYHAIGEYVRRGGGKAMSAAHPHARLNVCAFTLGALPGDHVETLLAFEQAIERVGPDDFYCLKKALDAHVDELSMEQLLAFVRASGADVDVLLRCLPALSVHAAKATVAERRELARLTTAAWAGHYAVDESRDVAFELGTLLCGVGAWEAALPLFEASVAQYGSDRATLFNLALCLLRTGQPVDALAIVTALLAGDPSFEGAQALRVEIADELARATDAAG